MRGGDRLSVVLCSGLTSPSGSTPEKGVPALSRFWGSPRNLERVNAKRRQPKEATLPGSITAPSRGGWLRQQLDEPGYRQGGATGGGPGSHGGRAVAVGHDEHLHACETTESCYTAQQQQQQPPARRGRGRKKGWVGVRLPTTCPTAALKHDVYRVREALGERGGRGGVVRHSRSVPAFKIKYSRPLSKRHAVGVVAVNLALMVMSSSSQPSVSWLWC